MKGKRKTLILPICLGLLSLILVYQVKAQPSKLFVRNVEFNSDSIKIGEEANIKFHVTNLSKNKTNCNITLFCGGKKLNQKEITVEGQSSTPVYHSFNTTGMAKGSYSIESIIQSSDQQKMFDLGELNIIDSILPEPSISAEPASTDAITIQSFDSLVSLLLIPIGIISSIIIITQHKNKKPEIPEDEFAIEDVPKLLGGIFNMQQNEETKNSTVKELEEKNNYIC